MSDNPARRIDEARWKNLLSFSMRQKAIKLSSWRSRSHAHDTEARGVNARIYPLGAHEPSSQGRCIRQENSPQLLPSFVERVAMGSSSTRAYKSESNAVAMVNFIKFEGCSYKWVRGNFLCRNTKKISNKICSFRVSNFRQTEFANLSSILQLGWFRFTSKRSAAGNSTRHNFPLS